MNVSILSGSDKEEAFFSAWLDAYCSFVPLGGIYVCGFTVSFLHLIQIFLKKKGRTMKD